MIRKSAVLVVLGLLVAAFSFAAGQSENQAVPPGATGEKVTVTGKVFLQNRAHPELTSGSQQYLLLVPRRLTWGLEVKEGEQVTVEGYKTTAPRWGASPDAVYLQVTGATIQGRQYDLADYLGGPRGAFGGPGQGFGRGGRGPMMGGRGTAQGFGRGQGYGPGGYCPDCFQR